jgi:hypothetical protein
VQKIDRHTGKPSSATHVNNKSVNTGCLPVCLLPNKAPPQHTEQDRLHALM